MAFCKLNNLLTAFGKRLVWGGQGREGSRSPHSGGCGRPVRTGSCRGCACLPWVPRLWGWQAGSRAQRAEPWGGFVEEHQPCAGFRSRRGKGLLQAQGWGWGLSAKVRSGPLSRCLSVLPGLGVLPAPNPEVACSGLPEQRAGGAASSPVLDTASPGRVGFPRGLPPWLVDELSSVRASLRFWCLCVWISSRRTPVRGTRTHSECFLLR